jgi:hypothetical protein
MSLTVGTPVYRNDYGLLRFGVIQSKMKDSHGWTHFTIGWTEDDKYISNVLESTNHPPRRAKEIYRCDEVRPLDIDRLSLVAQSLKEHYTK